LERAGTNSLRGRGRTAGSQGGNEQEAGAETSHVSRPQCWPTRSQGVQDKHIATEHNPARPQEHARKPRRSLAVGRTFSFWQAPGNGGFAEDERMQALRAAIPVEESFLELAGGGPAARVDFAAFLQPGLRETDRHPAEHAQGKGRLGVVDPAVIFPQRDVQRVMQAALDDPVAPLEFEKAARIQFFQGETADEINDFGGLFTLAANPAP